jgi:hypothetical protein
MRVPDKIDIPVTSMVDRDAAIVTRRLAGERWEDIARDFPGCVGDDVRKMAQRACVRANLDPRILLKSAVDKKSVPRRDKRRVVKIEKPDAVSGEQWNGKGGF